MPITATPVNPTDPHCCGDQSVVSAPVSTTPVNCPPVAPQPTVPTNDDDVPLAGKPGVIVLPASGNQCISWQLRTPTGVPVNLTSCLVQPQTGPAHRLVVRFRLKEALSTCPAPSAEANNQATIVSAEQGRVKICLANELTTPGVYLGSFGVFDEYDNPGSPDPDHPEVIQALLYENEFFVVAEATTWSGNSGLPRWATLREQLADFPGENTLTMQQRFSDTDIASAAVYCIEYWNEALPITPHVRYDTTSFPYRANWIEGIKGRLFMLQAERLRSTHLPLSGGGLSYDDKAKYDQYDQRGLYLWSNYAKFVQAQKTRTNMLAGASSRVVWGYAAGPYRI